MTVSLYFHVYSIGRYMLFIFDYIGNKLLRNEFRSTTQVIKIKDNDLFEDINRIYFKKLL